MRRTQPAMGGGLPPLTVRISDACRMTGIGRSKLYELIKDGAVEVIKVGAITLVPMSSIRALLDRGHQGTAISIHHGSADAMHPFVVSAILTSSLAETPELLRQELCSIDSTVRTKAEDKIVRRMIAVLYEPSERNT